MCPVIAELKAEADRLEWDALYTMKGHFNSAMLWNITHYSLGILAVILGALAGKQFFDDQNVLGSTIAATSAALTAVITFLKPSEKAQPHHEAGVSCAEIKRKARMFHNISVVLETDARILKQQLDGIIEAYHETQKNAPPVPWLAYQITRSGIRKGEHTYNEEGEKK
ncbi:MAG: SLATT domain-containing protein [Cephaloticoccus sp.]|nr:SLATT domain-containing protein [Cephaloticoccus sp.]MCF7759392.1 SLATT domain-containing protein [Cephaloticoccus sp.]